MSVREYPEPKSNPNQVDRPEDQRAEVAPQENPSKGFPCECVYKVLSDPSAARQHCTSVRPGPPVPPPPSVPPHPPPRSLLSSSLTHVAVEDYDPPHPPHRHPPLTPLPATISAILRSLSPAPPLLPH
ncbi:PREDICTED: leucine-rich repeat extensin-like protein 2 [Cyprinodon variegatus]|uniref:leucine-rich repeat extensin-like protein 2 n=1 Tax=Cyprinodon variegatus TaxID=28743 RepID=UPI0007429DC5|nr:PREDICTED: leucine-rich repeat extensin-like protein 2 [Cyprinodon variegatus]